MKFNGINGLKTKKTKSGRVSYYLDGKRVSSKVASEFRRKDSAKRSARAKESAKQLLYYKGKALPKEESFLLSMQFKDQVDKGERRLDKMKTKDGKKIVKNKASLDRVINQYYKGELDFFKAGQERGRFKSGYEGKIERKGVKDIAFWIQESAFNRFKIILTTPEFQRVTGKVRVLERLMNIEVFLMDVITSVDLEVGVKAEFIYNFDVSMNMKTINIDLSPTTLLYTSDLQKAVKKKQGSVKLFRDLTIKLSYSV